MKRRRSKPSKAQSIPLTWVAENYKVALLSTLSPARRGRRGGRQLRLLSPIALHAPAPPA